MSENTQPTPTPFTPTEFPNKGISEDELEEMLGPFPSPIEELGAPSATPPDEYEPTEEEI